MGKIFWDGILENSFAVFLIVVLFSVIAVVFGSLSFTTMRQMAIIMVAMYGFCRIYQRYRRSEEKEYSLLGGKNLEKLFAVLTVFIMAVALYVDVCRVARL